MRDSSKMEYSDKDPIKELLLKYYNENIASKCEEILYKELRIMLREHFGDLLDEQEMSEANLDDKSDLHNDYNKNILSIPLSDELIGHMTLALMEALTSISQTDHPFHENISLGLESLMFAAEGFEKMGKDELARNIYERVSIACENILSISRGYFLRGLLFETMAVCRLVLNETGVHDCFEKSYKQYLKEDIELKDKGVNGGIEIYYFLEPGCGVCGLNERYFNEKVNPIPSLQETIDKSKVERLSIERSLFFLEHTKGM